jgi:hypothetical protein
MSTAAQCRRSPQVSLGIVSGRIPGDDPGAERPFRVWTTEECRCDGERSALVFGPSERQPHGVNGFRVMWIPPEFTKRDKNPFKICNCGWRPDLEQPLFRTSFRLAVAGEMVPVPDTPQWLVLRMLAAWKLASMNQ